MDEAGAADLFELRRGRIWKDLKRPEQVSRESRATGTDLFALLPAS